MFEDRRKGVARKPEDRLRCFGTACLAPEAWVAWQGSDVLCRCAQPCWTPPRTCRFHARIAWLWRVLVGCAAARSDSLCWCLQVAAFCFWCDCRNTKAAQSMHAHLRLPVTARGRVFVNAARASSYYWFISPLAASHPFDFAL